ncbi:hypothetical protein GCM10023156_10300 [Novipirellula rosea]|uniref:DUF1795 domain-containing protein n=2 Tax=Novipirellula rosea TaxID=1031540 RepID=A0ABP8MDK6_9BACT
MVGSKKVESTSVISYKVAGIVLVVVALAFPAILVILLGPPKPEPSITGGVTPVLVGGGRYAITVPDTFKPSDAEIPFIGGISMADGRRDLLVMIKAVSWRDISAKTLSDHADNLAELVVSDLPNAEASQKIAILANGRAMTRQNFVYSERGTRVQVMIELQHFADDVVEIRFAATPSRFEDWDSEIDQISNSLVETTYN